MQPFSQPPLRLHFTNNNPFAEAEVLDREVEVSHWGNVAVEELYSIRHVGAKQKVPARLIIKSWVLSCLQPAQGHDSSAGSGD